MDGIIIINKEKKWTSHDVVNKVKRLFNEKVGHTGTLDPNATGVLPLLIGKGIKLSQYLIEHDKEYEVTLKLGKKTTTADIEGEIIEKREVTEGIMDRKNVEKVLELFLGEQEQIPPIYSAIKVNGKKLYEYARENKPVEIKSRKINIYNIKLIDINKEEHEVMFNVECSKGTYIRRLCEDIAEKLGTVGHMQELNRTKVGSFNINQAITIKELEENINNNEFLDNHFLTVNMVKNNLIKKGIIVENIK